MRVWRWGAFLGAQLSQVTFQITAGIQFHTSADGLDASGLRSTVWCNAGSRNKSEVSSNHDDILSLFRGPRVPIPFFSVVIQY